MAFNKLAGRWMVTALVALMGLMAGRASAVEERFPPPEFSSGYSLPQTQVATARAGLWLVLDVAVLAGALGVAAWLVHSRRSRRWLFWLTVFCVGYFGFYRRGCVCPVGSIQNVTLSLFHPDQALAWIVAVFFALPLAVAVLFGRVFCSSVCPLGAIQDLVLLRPVQTPRWVDASVSLLAYAYLGLAVLYAATGSEFVVCRFDPFVGFFRLSAGPSMLMVGGGMLAIGTVIGRPYCRFLCPYGVLMRWASRWSHRSVQIVPPGERVGCVNCHLCSSTCPFGAIEKPVPKATAGRRFEGRGRLALMLVVWPVLVAGGAWLGYGAGPVLAGADSTVSAGRRAMAQPGGGPVVDRGTIFRASAGEGDKAREQVDKLEQAYRRGAMILGGFLGLVVGWRLIRLSIRRTHDDYRADPAACLACGRCYRACPVEHVRLKRLEVL